MAGQTRRRGDSVGRVIGSVNFHKVQRNEIVLWQKWKEPIVEELNVLATDLSLFFFLFRWHLRSVSDSLQGSRNSIQVTLQVTQTNNH